MSSHSPELMFNEELANPVFPIPIIKHAVLVPVAEGFPTHIQPEWDETGSNPQVFIGSWYAMLDKDGSTVRYGSAREQWENMHTPIKRPDGSTSGWLKVEVPIGYHTDQPYDIVTMIDDKSMPGGFREARKPVPENTLILKQPGGEIQHVRPEDEKSTYFSSEQAEQLGLTGLSEQEFASWAISNAIEQSVVHTTPNLTDAFTGAEV